MTSLNNLVTTGAGFIALSPAAAAPHVRHVARSKSTDGIFSATDLMQKPDGTSGAYSGLVPAYTDVTNAQLAEHLDLVLHHMVVDGQIVPAYTAGAGRFRLIAQP